MIIKFSLLRKLLNISVLPILLLLLNSCSEKVRYQSSLILRNELNTPIQVTLHPKVNFLGSPGTYKSSPSEGGAFVTTFTLSANDKRDLYYDTKLGIKPAELATTIFDSITVIANNTTIRLLPHATQGFRINPFNSDSYWEYKKEEFDTPRQFRNTIVKSDNYYFIIRDEHLIR